ncbi:MAG: hypothetical protein J5871_00270 [Bacteroidales bacterium]|nr:hypothetical protein [Bacteroidales bacterium]
MKMGFGKYLAVILLLLALPGWSQQKIYTKGMKLKDFPTKTTKVVLNGYEEMNETIRTEVAARWSISPFEFCRAEDYEELKTDNAYYFLHLTGDGDIVFLTLSKGGEKDDADPLRQPFDVVSLPVTSEREKPGEELPYIAASVDILQDFVEQAMVREGLLYTGLSGWRKHPPKGASVVTRKIRPASGKAYRLRFDADTHALYSFDRSAR